MRIPFKWVLVFVSLASPFASFALPNPAAVNCTDKGNQYVLLNDTGICIFADGSYCEEWSYYRGRCVDGINFFPGGKFKEERVKQYCATKKDGVTTIKWCKSAS